LVNFDNAVDDNYAPAHADDAPNAGRSSGCSVHRPLILVSGGLITVVRVVTPCCPRFLGRPIELISEQIRVALSAIFIV